MLQDLLIQYRDMKIELKPALDLLAELEMQIKEHVRETGETIDIDGASITVRPGTVRKTWDNRALEGYAVSHPEILQFLKKSPVAPAVTIKVIGL